MDAGPNYIDGDTLQASCTVTGTRPYTPVTLIHVDDRVLQRDEFSNFDTKEPWTWPWDLQNDIHRVSSVLHFDDNLNTNKILKCVVQQAPLELVHRKPSPINVYRK